MSWVWTLWPFAAWALVAAFWLLALAGVACDGSALRWRVRTSEKGGLFSGSAPLPFCVWPALPEATGRTAEIVGVFMVQPDQWGWRVRRYMVAEISSLASCSVRFSRTSRSEEHTSELQSLMRSSYAVFCLKKKKIT